MRKYGWLYMIGILLILSMAVGCGKRSTETKDPSLSNTLIEDEVKIPEDGIITADQFNAFAGTERVISFLGEKDGISYTWAYPGRNIHNAQDMDLSIDFIMDEELADIKELANHAGHALGLTLKGKGTITVPTLTLVYPEAWDADLAVLTKQVDGSMYRMSDVDIEVDDEAGTTTLTTKITELGDTYYIVAGNSGVGKSDSEEVAKEDKTEEAETEAKQNEDLEDGSGADSGSGSSNQVSQELNQNKQTLVSQKEDANQKEQTGKKEAESKSPAKTDKDKGTSDSDKKEEKKLTCTISINCATIHDNMDKLDKDKKEFVPEDGWILMPVTVEFQEGDTVLDVLKAVCRSEKITLEHNGSYVEGINQLYELDCGELSGWMFSVDGWFPNYGADEYVVSDGETISWLYTCDLGKDVGDNSMW